MAAEPGESSLIERLLNYEIDGAGLRREAADALRAMTEAMKAALRQAFDAGAEQGSDEATAWEWGCSPRQKRDEAFNDLFEEWNKGPILELMAITAPRDAE